MEKLDENPSIKKFIPKNTLKEIIRHIKIACRKGKDQWKNASSDEDTITGSLCAFIKKDWTFFSKKDIKKGRWKIEYKKLGLKDEKNTGADGIIQIEIFDTDKSILFRKGVLFQSKKSPKIDYKRLNNQIKELNKYGEKSFALFLYSPYRFLAVDNESFKNDKFKNAVKIDDFISSKFLGCVIGKEGNYYDFKKNKLILETTTAPDVQINHHLQIFVEEL